MAALGTINTILHRLPSLTVSNRRVRLGWAVVLPMLVSSCAGLRYRSVTADVMHNFQRNLEEFDRLAPAPFPRQPGYLATQDGIVLDMPPWAERAGLQRGDQIISINKIEVRDREERARVIRRITEESFSLGVNRAGAPVSVTLPCRDARAVWSAERSYLTAGAAGDWDTCDRGVAEDMRLVGMPTPSSTWSVYQCALGRNRSRGQLTDAREANLLYQYNLLLLRHGRYAQRVFDANRGAILTNVSYLRRAGYQSLGDDLQAQLDSTERERGNTRLPTRQPPVKEAATRGTGFLVRPDGTVLTAFHVVANATDISVICPGHRATQAALAHGSRNNDIAVLRSDELHGMPYLSLAAARSARPGDSVFTVGFPATQLLGTEPKFAAGSISALSGPGGEPSVMQTTVPVQPGNSGGPVVNDDGFVVGIVTSSAAVATFLRVTGTVPQNVNWAVRSEYAAPLFEAVATAKARDRRDAIERVLSATCMIDAR